MSAQQRSGFAAVTYPGSCCLISDIGPIALDVENPKRKEFR